MLVLPSSSAVNRAIPKNTFDKYLLSGQKKLFSEFIEKIKWLNKLSTETINLPGKEVKEIQVFELTLKKKTDSDELLNIIDRYIPYHIVFILKCQNLILISAAQKHAHPTTEDTSVIDWRFSTDWISEIENQFQLNLKLTLDEVFVDLCLQLSGKVKPQNQNFSQFIIQEQKRKQLVLSISKLEAEVKNCQQFNKKVELNMELQKRISELEKLK